MVSQIWMKLFPIDLPPPGTFDSQTALVTGATGGLGLATAVHLVNLGAKEVIISSRSEGKGREAVAEIERLTDGKAKGKVRVVVLDMLRYESVVRFAEEVAMVGKGRGGVDLVCLNAGAIGSKFVESPEGWEETLQVNALSTGLLALLLLQRMKEERRHRAAAAHMLIVGSGKHLVPDANVWNGWAKGGESILGRLSTPEEAFKGIGACYDNSKLVAEYVFKELCKRAVGPDGRPLVILNTCCPGSVATSLSRNLEDSSVVLRAVTIVYKAVQCKTPEAGARTFIAALNTTEAQHGEFVQFYIPRERYAKVAHRNLESDAGIAAQAQVWKEVTEELESKVPGVKQIV